MNMYWCSSKTDFTIEESIPKMCDNTHFHISNVTHGGRNNYQVTLTFMKNQENTLINTEEMKFDEHALVTDCTIEESIPKLYENTPFHISNVTHGGRNNYQVTLTFMKNQENTLISTEEMKFDEHALVLIKNRLHN